MQLWPFGLVRSLLGPILAPLAMFTLCRRRTSFAFAVFLFGFVVPRVWSSDVGRLLVGVARGGVRDGVVVAHPRHLGRRAGPATAALRLLLRVLGVATIVATLAVLAELVLVKESWLRNVRPETPLRGGVWPYVLPVGAVVIVTFVTWYWAKVRWRVLITVLNAAIVGGWVWFVAKTATDEHEPWQSLALLGSFWWALIVMILVTTLLGYNIDFAALPDPPEGRSVRHSSTFTVTLRNVAGMTVVSPVGCGVVRREQLLELPPEVVLASVGAAPPRTCSSSARSSRGTREVRRRRHRRDERVGVALARDVLRPYARGGEALDDVVLHAPGHRADEALGRRRGVRRGSMRRSCATSVGSPGIQLPMTMRPPGRVTRTISLATANGFGANIAPKTLTTRSNDSSLN